MTKDEIIVVLEQLTDAVRDSNEIKEFSFKVKNEIKYGWRTVDFNIQFLLREE